MLRLCGALVEAGFGSCFVSVRVHVFACRYLNEIAEALKLPKETHTEMTSMAGSMLNDSLKTDLSLCYPPYLLAISAIHIVALMCRVDLKPWLEGLRLDMHLVRLISSVLLDVYEASQSLTEDRLSTALGRLPMHLP
eukprot:TRINITY_DN18159_c0_g2_i2.p1 TRINITY_DN18159_c0_g2~~TRINITY_DN18159_c0_g2_i2.p1  ORF type:complete len:137 (-),score=5.88 TRINITY_DN18159_c0_g2_i2:145-555(-)